MLEDSQGNEERVTLEFDIFDFGQSEDPSGVPESIHMSSEHGRIVAQWANLDMNSARSATLTTMLDTWVTRYEMWLGRAQLDTSFVDVGLLDTRCSATSLSWHTGVKLDTP